MMQPMSKGSSVRYTDANIDGSVKVNWNNITMKSTRT